MIETTRRMAPRIATHTTAGEPFIVVGELTAPTGLGVSAQLCYEALKASGADVIGIDLPALNRASRWWRPPTCPPRGGTLLLHVNGPFVPLALLRLPRVVVRSSHIVGVWAWELPALPDEWNVGFDFVHDIWAPSSFTAGVIATKAGGRPVHVVPHPASARHVYPPLTPEAREKKPFTVLSIFNAASSLARKNPVAAIQAFTQAFGNSPDCRLILKTDNLDDSGAPGLQLRAMVSGRENVTLIDESWPPERIDRLYAEADVVLSLHRAEGFGLSLAEAMLFGRPVIATNWSGNTDYLSSDVGCPIAYRLVSATDPQRIYDYPDLRWAEPDIQDAAAALRALYDNPKLCRQLGERAGQVARQLWSPERYVTRVRELLAP